MKKNLLYLLLVSASAVHAASFDCSKASSQAEKLICSTPQLSQADERLYKDYLAAKKATGNHHDFKTLVKQNWQTREKCTTVECLANWYEHASQQYQMLSANDAKACMDAGDTTTLRGLLIRMTYPGPPNYESIEDGDTPETYFVLRPDSPIACATDAPQFASHKLMQLVLKSGDYKRYQDLVGGSVEVSGILLYSETGHHHTPLMIETQSIVPVK